MKPSNPKIIQQLKLNFASSLKLMLVSLLLICSYHSFSQSGQKWATGGNGNSSGDFLGTTNAYPIIFKTNGVERMRLTETGFLGIGLNNPTERLDVLGNFNLSGNALIGGNFTVLGNTNFNGPFVIGNNFTINGQNSSLSSVSGFIDFTNTNLYVPRLGIGTTSPSENLHVTGNSILNGNVTISNQLTVQGHHIVNGPTQLNNGLIVGGSSSLNGNTSIAGFLDIAGVLKNNALANQGVTFLKTNNSGEIQNFPLASSNDVLYGNGAWAPLPAPIDWSIVGNNMLAIPAGKIGIGTSNPSEKLEVVGNIKADSLILTKGLAYPANQPLSVTTLNVSNTIQTNQIITSAINSTSGFVKFGNNSIYVGTTTNDIYADNGDLFIQSNPTFNFNTIINANNVGNVGIGTATAPSEKLDVSGNIKASGTISGNTIKTGSLNLNGNVPSNPPLPLHDEITSANGKLVFGNALGFNGDMKIGIGTKDPQKALHIATFHVAGPHLSHQGIRLENHSDIIPSEPVGYNGTSIWDLEPVFYGGNALPKFQIGTPGSPKLTILDNGNVGIGATDPLTKLQVNGSISIYDGDGNTSLFFGAESVPSHAFGKWGIQYEPTAGGLNFWVPSVTGNSNVGNYALFLKDNGDIGIGTPLTSNPNNYKLAVNGTIGAKHIKVESVSATWPDYVFKDDYQMMTLDELEKFTKVKKHLPGIDTAEEIQENGIDVSGMFAKLLKKNEEAVLYILQLKKENEELARQIAEINKKIK